jgi:hypothetical protein
MASSVTSIGLWTSSTEPPRLRPPDNREASFERLGQQRRAQGDQHGDAKLRAAFSRVEGPQLHDKLVFARISVADEIPCAGIQVLLGKPDALAKRGGLALVENADAAARALGDLDAVQARGFVVPTRTDRDRCRCCPRSAARVSRRNVRCRRARCCS